jgi:hypothetical protein
MHSLDVDRGKALLLLELPPLWPPYEMKQNKKLSMLM